MRELPMFTLAVLLVSCACHSVSRLFLLVVLKNVEAETVGVKHQPVPGTRLVHLLGNEARVFNLLQVEVGLALLDSLTNQLG